MDGEINLKKQLISFETWRDGFEFVRPKWGIYRSLAKEKNKLNPQDQILMNNFSIKKWPESSVEIKSTTKPLSR
jgi:hypothetical protein